ncbi:MAG: YqgE/AlgH family protein [Bacteroidia bacterium]|nr:YqgE/AlgH family protein [Bacteroidia bacterium]
MTGIEFFRFKNENKVEKGRLLISEPFSADPNFVRSVVLLCDHNESGSFGFVLNKPSLVRVNEVLDRIHNLSEIVYVGGPVQQDTLHFIHTLETIDNPVAVCQGIYWGGTLDSLTLMDTTAKISDNEIRFFLGYCGWGPGQLEAELEDDAWIVCDFVTERFLFQTDPQDMWKVALDNMGGRFSVYANYPTDPRLN